MANITVSVPLSNITVNTTSNVVNVSTTTSNVVVSELSQANTAAVRQALSVTDTGGDGSLTYSNTTGVFTYTGPNQDEANARIDAAPANVRAHLSGTSPITYNSGTGAIGIDANAVLTGSTTDDLAEGSTNLYWSTSGQAKTTTNLPEGTNLYYTVARANTAIEDFDGVLTPSSLTATGNVEGAVLKGTGTLGLVVTGNATIGGNLDVTGNINSETVVDLLVEDRNITLQYGLVGAPTNNAHIFVDRGSSANVALFWDETNDTWKFNSSNIANTDADIQLVPFYGSNSAIHYEGNIIIEPDVNTSFYTQNVNSIQAFAVRSNVNNQYAPVANIGLRYDRKDGLYNVSAPVMRVWDDTAGAGINLADNGNAFVSIYSKTANVLTGNTLSGAFHVGSSQTVSAGEIGVEIEFYPQLFKIQGTTPTDPNYHLVETLIGDRKYIPHIDIKSIAPGSSDTWGANTAYRPSAKTYNLDPFIIVDEHIELQAKTDAYADSNVAANVDVLKLTTSNASRTFEFVVDGTSNLSSVNATTLNATSLNVPTITGLTTLSLTGNISANNIIGNLVGDVTGTVSDISNHTTTDLAEGTNLYYTNARANAAFVDSLDDITTDILPAGGQSGLHNLGENSRKWNNLYVANTISTNGNVYANTMVAGDNIDTSNITANIISFNHEITQSQGTLDDISHITFGPVGGTTEGTRAYELSLVNNASVFSAPYNFKGFTFSNTAVSNNHVLGISMEGGSEYPVGSNGLVVARHLKIEGELDVTNSNSNITTTANISADTVLTDKIESGASANLNLKGQADGIHLNKTVDSTETRILDVDTDGYRITSADVHTANIASYTGGVKGMLILGTATAGSPTITTLPLSLIGYPAGHQIAGQSGSTSYFDLTGGGQTIEAAFANASAFGGVQNNEGWKIYNTASSSFFGTFDRNTHISSISGSTITLNKNAIGSGTTAYVLFPGAASSTQEMDFVLDYTVGSYNFEGLQPFSINYALPDTLSNVTIDRTSVSDSFDLANVKLGHIADLEVGDNDYVRVDRGLLIGSQAQPDPFSSTINNPSPSGASMLGLTLEHDGETEYEANNTPQVKFLINNYTANSILDMATTPSWASDYSSTNVTIDNQYLSAPAFNFKTLNSSKELANGRVLANTVVGSLVWNAPTSVSALDTVGTEALNNTGSDLIHPPAGIKVRMASDQVQTSNVSAMDMYIQSTYRTSYRDGSTTAKGGIPRTFLANKEGNTVIAAKADGKITLRPNRDYGDSANAATFTENRYAHELHEYHEFLGASFANTSAKTGTLVEIQPKSGETGGSTDFNYDSKGNATLRLSTHEANNTVRQQWDITNDQATGNLTITDVTNSTDVMHFDGTRVFVEETLKFQNLTTTEINALPSPQSGDTVYNTTLNQICFYDGTTWKKLSSSTM